MNHKNGSPLIVPDREPMETNEDIICTERDELCVDCEYPAHGFICWSQDGSCIKSNIRKIKEGMKLLG